MKREEIIAKWAEMTARERDAWVEAVILPISAEEARDRRKFGISRPHYTTDLSAAAYVLNAIPCEFYLYRDVSNKYVASFGYAAGEPCFDCGEEPFEIVAQGIAETGPEAIGLAAVIYKLRGVGADVAV